MHSKRAILAAAAAALLFTVSGCAAPRVEAAPTSTPTPSNTALPIDGEITDAHICGQVSAIVSLLHFARWRAETGQITELDHATIRNAAADGWLNMLTIPSAVGVAVEDAQSDLDAIMAAGGEGPFRVRTSWADLAKRWGCPARTPVHRSGSRAHRARASRVPREVDPRDTRVIRGYAALTSVSHAVTERGSSSRSCWALLAAAIVLPS